MFEELKYELKNTGISTIKRYFSSRKCFSLRGIKVISVCSGKLLRGYVNEHKNYRGRLTSSSSCQGVLCTRKCEPIAVNLQNKIPEYRENVKNPEISKVEDVITGER